ncbi:phosphoribosyl-ATP pyrophosphohydrolase [Devosia sp.]|uniref:phosphoribosyl-ATP pyrophosphohydrolase n=1 Tax=Devosia sp. TaxID=1871048 RepID=UPI003BAD18BE
MAGLAELSARIEQVSQLYAARCDIRRDDDWFALKLQEEAGELVAEYLRGSGRGRIGERSAEQIRTALADEAADLFAQLLLFCQHNGIDVEAALERKWFSHLNKQP